MRDDSTMFSRRHAGSNDQFYIFCSHRSLAQLGHENLIIACFKCFLMYFFSLKYALTQAQVINIFYQHNFKTFVKILQ